MRAGRATVIGGFALGIAPFLVGVTFIKTMWPPDQRSAQASFTREMCFDGP